MYSGLGFTVDTSGAAEGGAKGMSVGGAAATIMLVTPLAPVAAVAPILGGLIGLVAGGLQVQGGGMSSADKEAVYGPVRGLSASVDGTDNPFALDAIADAARAMSTAVAKFAADNTVTLDAGDVAAIADWDGQLKDIELRARQKASDLRSLGKSGTPLPVGSQQAAILSEAQAVEAAASAARSRKRAQSTARWIALAAMASVAAAGAAWWLKRRKQTRG